MNIKLARIAPIFAVTLLLVVTSTLFLMDRGSDKKMSQVTQAPIESGSVGNIGVMNDQTNGAVGVTGANSAEKTNAPVLSSLVAGLESKVAADPSNIGNQILLAQTYGEIGRLDDGIQGLKNLQLQQPNNPRVQVVLATLLSKNNDPNNLTQALELLTKIDKSSGDQRGAAMFHKGMILLKMNKKDDAVKEWKMALSSLPPSDPYHNKISKVLQDQNNSVKP